MKNSTFVIGIIVMLILAGGFVFAKSGNGNTVTGNSIVTDVAPEVVKGEVQKVVLSTKNYNYFPNTVNVKANQAVEITLDKSVTGCLRAFTIKDLGVSQYAKTPNDKIVFTPTQKGNFRFTCSMGMGYGTLVVE